MVVSKTLHTGSACMLYSSLVFYEAFLLSLINILTCKYVCIKAFLLKDAIVRSYLNFRNIIKLRELLYRIML